MTLRGNMDYKSLKCPCCGGAEFEAFGEKELLCWYCGSRVTLVMGQCPYCGFINEAGAGFCAHCGQDIAWECAICGKVNPAGARYCQGCGRDLDQADRIVRERLRTTAEWRGRRVTGVRETKEKEELDSQRRMAVFREKERARQEAIQRALAEQRERERKMLMITVGLVALLIVMAVVVSIVVWPR
jgi:predicted nucleic acid-binding Zn ribbon protein